MNESAEGSRRAYLPPHNVALALGTTVCVVAAAAAIVYATEIFLILLLALLFGLFLSRTSAWPSAQLPIAYGWCLTAVTSLLIFLAVASIAFFGMQINGQVIEASKRLDEAEQQIQDLANRYPAIKSLLSSTPLVRELVPDGPPKTSNEDTSTRPTSQPSTTANESESAPLLEQSAIQSTAKQGISVVADVFKSTFGLVVNSMLIFFVGLFLAVAPGSYRDGIVVLFPTMRRGRVREIMDLMGDSLWHWLIGRFGSMLVTGVGAGVLLQVLGVPMAITLGIVTALLTFIPNIGGLISLTLAVFFALSQSGATVVMVILGYLTLQLIESYLVTPLIQQRQVSLPPALLISFQVVMGVLFGILGAAVASPMLAAAKVCVEEAYIKDILESESDRPQQS